MGALVGLLARVYADVDLKGLLGTEVGHAEGTGMRPFAHVRMDVHLEGRLVEESRLAV